MKNILVAIDFDERTKVLLDNAAEIAKKNNSKIWILHIMEPSSDIYGYSYGTGYIPIHYVKDFRTQELQKEHKTLTKYSEELQSQGVKAEGLLIQGPTVKLILDEALKLKIDLIVIGSHKHSFLYNALSENTSSEVIKKSKIPLLVVPL
jgi:nucleotide-binding universal stress UspA family protein